MLKTRRRYMGWREFDRHVRDAMRFLRRLRLGVFIAAGAAVLIAGFSYQWSLPANELPGFQQRQIQRLQRQWEPKHPRTPVAGRDSEHGRSGYTEKELRAWREYFSCLRQEQADRCPDRPRR